MSLALKKGGMFSMVNKKRCLDELRGSSNLRVSHLLVSSTRA